MSQRPNVEGRPCAFSVLRFVTRLCVMRIGARNGAVFSVELVLPGTADAGRGNVF